MFEAIDVKQITAAIQRACQEAADKGVAVTVELEATGFFPNESCSLKVTATPSNKKG